MDEGERCLQKTGKWTGYNFIGWLKKTGKLVKDAFTGRCQKQVKDAILSVKDWKRLVQNYQRKWTQLRRCFTSDQRRHESEVANRSWPVRCFRLPSQRHPDKEMWCFTTRVQNAFGAETQPRLTASHAKQQKPREKTPELHYIRYC